MPTLRHVAREANAMQLRRSGKYGTLLGRFRLWRVSHATTHQARFKVPHAAVFTGRAVAHQRSHTQSVQAARPASRRAAHLRGSSDAWKFNKTLLKHVLVKHTIRQREEECKTQSHRVRSQSSRFQGCHAVTPNPSIERTRSGSAGLAFISFWAKPAPPPRAAHVKR